MAAFSDILLRTDAILQKYEHYDTGGQNSSPRRKRSTDPFSDKYFEIMDRVQELNLKSESLGQEKNRALKAAMNAELRKERVLLTDELTVLQQLIRAKGLPQSEEAERYERYEEAKKAVEEIPDGVGVGAAPLSPQRPTGLTSIKTGSIQINDSSGGAQLHAKSYKHTKETAEFEREYSIAKDRQEVALENIERGLGTLKQLGSAMGEEIERHDLLIDEVDAKMSAVTHELQTNNMKLKGMVTNVRSSRRFFIDIILICILLALGLYIYNMLK